MADRPDVRVHGDAVIAALETTGQPVGDGETPDNAGTAYYIVDPMPHLYDGPLTGDSRWFRFVYQVRCIAIDRQSVQWLQHKAIEVLDDPSSFTVAGRVVVDASHVPSAGSPVRPDEETQPKLFFAGDRFELETDPA